MKKMTAQFAITVEFELLPGCRDRFLELIRQNAATSVQVEEGCRRFDVLIPARENAVCLYEVYTDPIAFNAHLVSDHYRVFDRATKDMVAKKNVAKFEAFPYVSPA